MNYESILSLNPDIDLIIPYNNLLTNTRKSIKREKYDLIIDLQKNPKSFYLSCYNAGNVVRYKKDNLKKLLLVNFKINLFKGITPVWKKYMQAVNKFIGDEDWEFVTTRLKYDKQKMFDNKYIVVAPASRHFTKTYPKEKFVSWINEFTVSNNIKVILVGDEMENEKKICKYIESNCRNVINMCGGLTIGQLAAVIYNSEYVICNDSGILHLAETIGKRVTAIFGSTVKEFGFFPQLKESSVVEIAGLKCRPCSHLGREKCPLVHFKCMNEIRLNVKN